MLSGDMEASLDCTPSIGGYPCGWVTSGLSRHDDRHSKCLGQNSTIDRAQQRTSRRSRAIVTIFIVGFIFIFILFIIIIIFLLH